MIFHLEEVDQLLQPLKHYLRKFVIHIHLHFKRNVHQDLDQKEHKSYEHNLPMVKIKQQYLTLKSPFLFVGAGEGNRTLI